ncbi:unnamed protein product [Durusdinium trenchii]|uniref:Uncharacterized protein n=2 Tax=Durusdinium trenchii TaxID=1381693 RepID=A0ABP0P5X0_9DINO
MSRASRAWLAGALTGSVEASEREIMNAIYFELVGPLQDADCFCTGPWASFHHMFNFTLAHAPLTAGTLAERSAPSVALCERATPLVRKTLRQIMEEDGRLKKEALRTLSSENWVSFDGHWCPTGLVAALSLCAAVHVQLARPEEEEEEDPVETIDWAQALVTWPDMLPDDCERHYWCLAYMEGLLALATVRHCGPCIAQAHWFITAQEVNDNVVRWLPWLRQRPGVPPPRWRSGIAAEASRPGKHRVRPALSLEAAGAWAGIRRKAPQDGTGATTLLNNMITAWSEPSSKLSWRQTLFEKIFGQLADLPGMQARGIQEVHVEGHPEDFTGRRSGLRFYIYNLPGALFEVLRQLHGRVREAESQPAACNLGLAPCTETHNPRGTFNSLRPFMAESTFLAKLLSGPDHVIVEDPNEASYFVVPFLSSMWCSLSAPFCWVRCSSQRPLNALLPLLSFYNASTAHRHLFLGTDSVGDLPQDLQMQPLVLHYGPSPCETGPLLTPPTITDDLPSPPGRWEFSSKDLLVFIADGGSSERPYRAGVLEQLKRWKRRLPQLFAVAEREERPTGVLPEVLWGQQIRRALFCPVLPGDNTFRMRIFHAILAGCIPVVMLFPGGSWYRSHGPPIASSFPFPSRIDWRGLSLELPFDPSNSTAFQWAKEMMVMLLQMDPRDVYRKQQLLVAAAPLLRFDFRGRAPDAFTALLDELAARPLRPPEHLECFDPRERFRTQRCLSGVDHLARGEEEIYGVVACCPKWGQSAPTEAQSCNVGRTADGSCVSFDEAEHGDPERQRNLKSHLEAILLRQSKFEEVLEEDQDCIF